MGVGVDHLSAARARDGAQRDFGLSKLGLVASIDDVTHHCKLAATLPREWGMRKNAM